MRFTSFMMVAGVAGAMLSGSALAQQSAPREAPCAIHNHVAGQLREIFGERAMGSGLTESGVLFELYVSPSGSWTLLATTPTGVSCLVGAGDDWEPRPPPEAFAAR